MIEKYQFKMDSMIGPLYLVATEKGLSGIHWKRQDAPIVSDLKAKKSTVNSGAIKTLETTVKQLGEYFDGKRKVFDLKIDIKGTEFQKKVWSELAKIPYGTTLSYKDIALILKSKAYRAVGSANGKNPLSIIVPCHRVISNNGGLGGYAGGLPKKTKLLNLEMKN